MNEFSMKPDWTITGGKRPDGKVMLIASAELRDVTIGIDHSYDYGDAGFFAYAYRPVRTGTEVTLAVTMPTCKIVIADTYEEALRILFAQWSPTGEPVMELTSGAPAIEA